MVIIGMAERVEAETSVERMERGIAARGGFAWRTVALVAGDALCFVVFAGVGRQQHGEASGMGALGQVIVTAAPFALGWFLVSPWVGAYRRKLTDGVTRMLGRTELAWLASYPIALALRLLIVRDGATPAQIAAFAIVILIANAVFLGLWRMAFAWLERLLARAQA
jgi:hypothetical protein